MVEEKLVFGCLIYIGVLEVSHLFGCSYPYGYYEGQCVYCPENTLYVNGTYILYYPPPDVTYCKEVCPMSKPYIFKRSCVEKCPLGFSEKRMSNIQYCMNETDGIEGLCPVNYCKEPFSFCYRMRCLATCPSFTFRYFNDCTLECPSDKPVIYNRTCVGNCPDDSSILQFGECVNNCSYGFLRSGVCVKKCLPGEFVKDNECVVKCDYDYTFENNDVTYCLDSCPKLTISKNGSCTTSCPKEFPFYLNNSCVRLCPKYSLYVLPVTTQYKKLLFLCVEFCPKYFTHSNRLCTNSCLPNEVLYKNECRITCPESDPYPIYLDSLIMYNFHFDTSYITQGPIIAKGICVKQCGTNFVLDGNQCFDDCYNTSRKMEFNHTCIEICPPQAPFLYSVANKKMYKCMDRCPYTINKNICTKYCDTKGKFHLNKTCFSECPNEYYTGNQVWNCELQCVEYEEQLTCVDECRSPYLYKDGKRCVESCAEVQKFHHQNSYTCVNTCPNVSFDDICVDRCDGRFLHNNSCVNSCPSGMLTNVELGDVRTTFWNSREYYNLKYRCETSCPDGKFVENDTCVTYCSESKANIYNDICVEKCPSSSPYRVKYHVNNTFNTLNILETGLHVSQITLDMNTFSFRCTNSCTENHFVLDWICFDTCPEGFFGYDNKCVQQCPSEASLKDMGKCVSSCSKIQINDTCAEFCENGLFLDENECVMQCSKHKFVYMRTKQSLICLETCPNQMVANTTGECMEMDECKDFIYKGRCQSTCPSFSFIVDKDQYKYCSSLEISYILFSLSVLILIAVVLFVSWIIARRCSASMKQKKFLSKESIYDKGDKHYITNVDLAIPKKVSKPNSGRENLAFSGSSTREAEFEETRL